jgi:hypothetical protein
MVNKKVLLLEKKKLWEIVNFAVKSMKKWCINGKSAGAGTQAVEIMPERYIKLWKSGILQQI